MLEVARAPRKRRLVGGVLAAAIAALGVAGLASRDGSASLTMIDSSNAPAVGIVTSSTSAVASSTTLKATTSTAPAPTTRPTTTTGPTTTTPPVTTTAPAPAFCPLAVGYVQDLRRMAISLTDPTQLRGLVQHASPAIAQSATAAPTEIRADVALLVTTTSPYVVALEKAGYELAKLPPDMVMKLQTPQVQDAINHVENYVRKACGSS